ncbi:hypothetical protein ES703_14538 [subsurface metagenome]
MKKVDIVIPCLKEPERVGRLCRLVKTIVEYTKAPYNIIIVISEESSAHNKNEGFKMSQNKYVCFVDEDVIIKQDGWLGLMVETLESYPQAGAVMPRLTFPDGRPQNKTSNVFDIQETKASCSACLLCRKGIAEFDEKFMGAWAEDEDFIMQLDAKGYKIYCDGRVHIHHLAQHNRPIEANEEYILQKWGQTRR